MEGLWGRLVTSQVALSLPVPQQSLERTLKLKTQKVSDAVPRQTGADEEFLNQQADLLHAYEELSGDELNALADALNTDREWDAFIAALDEVAA